MSARQMGQDDRGPATNGVANSCAPPESAGMTASGGAAMAAVSSRAGYFRWVICGLLLIGITKNYMDRQVLGLLKPTLQQEFGWNEIDYSNLVFAFQAAYALGMVLVGRLIDRVGTRLGYTLAMTFWSLASMAHALGGSLASFATARFALGFGEAGVFPASLKTVAEWFPKKERAFAVGIFNSGTSIGAIVTPLVVPPIALHWGWRWTFVFMGGIGFVWLIFWLLLYRRPEQHPKVNAGELAYIRSDAAAPAAKVPWARLLRYRQTWAFAATKFITDPIWWFYLFWVPDFLHRVHGLTLAQMSFPIVAIYLISDAGSMLGGWLSSAMLHRGRTVNAARKTTFLICALAVVPIVFAYRMESLWGAVALIGLAAAAHQGFSANLLTLPSDMFPSEAVGSVVGIGGMAGAIGGMLIAKVVGYALQWTGSYMVPFLMAGVAYLLGLAVMQVLAPRLEPVGRIE
ncbi:MAG TPA: MFS transporter [Candidatus Acidoferrum sp.]|nr:MFS transporter [Candidatus Acidoferrum sp.]